MPPQNNRINFRMNNDDYDTVKRNAKAKGYSRISDYLRSLALEHDRYTQEKIFQIDKNVKKLLEMLGKDRNI